MFPSAILCLSTFAALVAGYVPVTSEIKFCTTTTAVDIACATPSPYPGFACARPTVTTTVTDVVTRLLPPGICPLDKRQTVETTVPPVACPTLTIDTTTTVPCTECLKLPATTTVTSFTTTTKRASCPPLPHQTLPIERAVIPTTTHCPPLIQGPCYEVCERPKLGPTTICTPFPTPTGWSCVHIC